MALWFHTWLWQFMHVAVAGMPASGMVSAVSAQAAARAAELPTGQKVTWKKTDALFQTAGSGWAESTGTSFQDSGGRSCRFVRQSATKGGQILYRSDWTDIAVAAYSEESRDACLQSLASAIQGNSREIVTNTFLRCSRGRTGRRGCLPAHP